MPSASQQAHRTRGRSTSHRPSIRLPPIDAAFESAFGSRAPVDDHFRHALAAALLQIVTHTAQNGGGLR